MLEIKNLHASIGDKEILKGIDLTIPSGEVHAIMGPNGSGKSTLSYVLAGRDGYEVTQGSVTFNGKDLLSLKTEERAAAGVFLAHAIPGRNSWRHQYDVFKNRAKRHSQIARRERTRCYANAEASARQGFGDWVIRRNAEARRECRFFRRREKTQRNFADGRAGTRCSVCSTKQTAALTSTR